MLGGLLLQAIGAGGVAAFVWLKVRRQNLSGHVTAATIRLVWHGEVHTRQGIIVLTGGLLIYAAGSVVMARPYVTRPVTLFVAVPLAAIIGMLVLGAVAFIVALVIAGGADGCDGGCGGSDFDRRRKASRTAPQ